MNTQALILGEMLVLFAGGIAIAKSKGSETWTSIILLRAWKQGLAVIILLILLDLLAEAGAGGVAVALGALIDIGYALAAGGALGAGIVAAEKQLLSAKG